MGEVPAMIDLTEGLLEVAGEADRAATFAEGEYIPQESRDVELGHAIQAAGRAASLLEHLAPRIAGLEGGEDGLVLARDALASLLAARTTMREACLDIDAMATGTATSLFGDAAARIRGIADIALLEATPEQALFGAIMRGTD